MKRNAQFRKPPAFPIRKLPERTHGDQIWSVKRFQSANRYMVVFEILKPFDGYPCPGEYFCKYLTETEYAALRRTVKAGFVRIRDVYHVIEGNLVPVNKKRNPRHH